EAEDPSRGIADPGELLLAAVVVLLVLQADHPLAFHLADDAHAVFLRKHDTALAVADRKVQGTRAFEPHAARALGSDLYPGVHELALAVVGDRDLLAENAHLDERLEAVADPEHQSPALRVGGEIP